jgi:hypothetical protein
MHQKTGGPARYSKLFPLERTSARAARAQARVLFFGTVIQGPTSFGRSKSQQNFWWFIGFNRVTIMDLMWFYNNGCNGI